TALKSASLSSSGLPSYWVTAALPIPPPVNCCKSANGLVPVSHRISIKIPATTRPVFEKRKRISMPIANGEMPLPPPKEPERPRRSSMLRLCLLPCHLIFVLDKLFLNFVKYLDSKTHLWP